MHATINDEESPLLCAEAVLAATLALMTGHAEARSKSERQQMAERVGANLTQLAVHPALSSHFRMALWTLRTHWRVLEQQTGRSPAQQELGFWPSIATPVQ